MTPEFHKIIKINLENECFLKVGQNVFKVTFMYPKSAQTAAKVAQNGAEDAQSHPKMTPECPKVTHKCPKVTHKCPKVAPK